LILCYKAGARQLAPLPVKRRKDADGQAAICLCAPVIETPGACCCALDGRVTTSTSTSIWLVLELGGHEEDGAEDVAQHGALQGGAQQRSDVYAW
jgi:hypothetical protein